MMNHRQRIRSGLVRLILVRLVLGFAVTTGVVGTAALQTAPAAAQDGGAPKPPTTRDSDTAPKILNYLLLALLAGGVIGASVFPAKRGHQD